MVGHRIEDLLGRGGMGFVYKAEHLDLGRRVALKVLAPELAHDDEFRTRFMQESRMAARLEHPSIIPIYEAGAGDGLLYISMRLINGPDLGTIIAREGRMDAGRAVHLIAQIGNALDSAHRQGFVHRDVKPSNILVAPPSGDETGEHAWLCDFGLLKHFGATTGQRLTRTGAFMGTVQYVAPEQIEGRTLDGRADVYALACVLYECLTGIVPFDRETDVATLWAHLNDPPPTTRLVRPDLPGQLDAVIARAMAKRPDQRFATCGELVRAVRGVLAGPGAGTGAMPATRPAETAPAAAPDPGGYAPPSYGGPSSARRPPDTASPPGTGRRHHRSPRRGRAPGAAPTRRHRTGRRPPGRHLSPAPAACCCSARAPWPWWWSWPWRSPCVRGPSASPAPPRSRRSRATTCTRRRWTGSARPRRNSASGRSTTCAASSANRRFAGGT